MAASLTASFVLKLEDKLSSGIAALSKKLEALGALARKVQFAGLDGADRALDKVGASADRVGRKLDGIGQSARSAVAEIKRLSSQPIMVNSAGTAFLPPSVSRGMMAAAVAAAVGAGGGGGRMPAIPDASFFGGPQLRLAGPGGGGVGGIPLSFNPALLQVSALREGLRGAAGHARELNSHLREAGHGALGALTTGFGLFEPVREYAAYENVLRHIAITENVPREQLGSAIAGLTAKYNALALSTGQSAEKVAESANFLITTGIGGKAVDAMLPVIAKAATAYNTNIGDSVQAVFALKENLHVPDAQLGTAVSSGALAAKEGHFSFQDMSRYLPAVAPIAAMSGLKGLGGAQELMASLETSRRNSGTSEEAFTNYRDYLSHLFGDPKRGLAHGFQKYGVDLSAVLLQAEKNGISAPEAVVAQVKQLVKGKSAYETNLIIGSLFHNQQSASYLRGRLADDAYFTHTRDKLQGTDPDTIQNDFLKAFDAPQIQLNRLQEALKQIVRRFGEGFAGLVPPITHGLEAVLALFAAIDAIAPGAVNKVLGVAGGFLAVMAALGVLVPMFKVARMGFMLVFNTLRFGTALVWALTRGFLALLIAGGPIVWIIAAIAAAAALIWHNWDAIGPRFWALWGAVRDSFGQFRAWLGNWIGGAMQRLIESFKAAWTGLGAYFSGIIASWLAPFDAFLDGLRARIEQARRLLGGGTPDNAPSPGGPGANPNPGDQRFQGGNGRPIPFAPINFPGGRVGFDPIEIRVTTEPGTRVEAPRRILPNLPNLGPMPDRA